MQARSPQVAGFAAAGKLVCFFLPWILVSCQGEPVMSVSGWQIATGSTIQTAFGPQVLDPSPDLMVIVLAALGSLALAFLVIRRSFSLRIAAIAWTTIATLSAAWLMLRFIGVEESAQNRGGMGVQIQMQYGYWGTLLASFALVAAGVMGLRFKQPLATASLPAVEPGIATLTATSTAEHTLCPTCKTANPSDYHFCMSCGATLHRAEVQA
jgi:energy-converting hydrogenase Eha subunit E